MGGSWLSGAVSSWPSPRADAACTSPTPREDWIASTSCSWFLSAPRTMASRAVGGGRLPDGARRVVLVLAPFSPHITPTRYLTAEVPGTGGVLKERDEDFLVEEL